MSKTLTKSALVDQLSQKTGLAKTQVNTVLDQIAALAHKEARNAFTLPGFGKLVLVQRKARLGRNPKTGESIQIPAKKVVKFRVSKIAKDAILGPKK